MSFGPLPDFPVSPIVVRKTARYNRNGAHTNVYPYISTPVCGIPRAVRKGGTVLSGSSASRLTHDKRSAGSSHGQGPILGAGKMAPPTSTGGESGKERAASSGGRTLSKSSPEVRSGSKTSGERSRSKGRSTESKVGENVGTNTESSKRPVDNENSKTVPKQPKLAARRPGKDVLRPVQNTGDNKQTDAVQSYDEGERGKNSSQSSNPSNGKPSTDSRRLRRERKASTSSSVASNDLRRTSRTSSVAVSKSTRTQDFNSKTASTDLAAKSLDVAAGSRISGPESALQVVVAVEPNASARRFFKSPLKPHLVERVDKKLSKGSKAGGSDRQVSTAKRQDRRDSVYDLNSSSESSHQIAKQQRPLSALRKRRIEQSAAGSSTSDDVNDGRQGHGVKRRRAQDLQLNSAGVEISGSDVRRDEEPLRMEIRVKPKVHGRWKHVSKSLRDYISVTSDQVFVELLKNVTETDAPGVVKCAEELKTRLFNRIERIKVPTSKASNVYFNLIDQQSYLQSEVRETQDSIEHLQKLIERTRQEIAALSEGQLPSND